MATNTPVRVEVDRDKWDRGGPEGGHLYHSCTGQSCVLGFVLRARGIPDEFLDANGTPSTVASCPDLPEEYRGILKDFCKEPSGTFSFFNDEDWVAEMWSTNDSEDLEDEDRELELTRIAKDHGIELVFVGGDDA